MTLPCSIYCLVYCLGSPCLAYKVHPRGYCMMSLQQNIDTCSLPLQCTQAAMPYELYFIMDDMTIYQCGERSVNPLRDETSPIQSEKFLYCVWKWKKLKRYSLKHKSFNKQTIMTRLGWTGKARKEYWFWLERLNKVVCTNISQPLKSNGQSRNALQTPF